MKKMFFMVLIVLAISGCSSGEGEQEVFQTEKITPSDTIYTYDSLTEIGFKKSKKFKVEGLTKANSAYFGFLKEQPKIDYEVRFYDSHQDAVGYGTKFAEERTGEDAVLKKEDATWKEGVKEARSCTSNIEGVKLGGHHIGTCMHPKYGDYIIYGNTIVLCQGHDAEVSMVNCSKIIEKLLKEK